MLKFEPILVYCKFVRELRCKQFRIYSIVGCSHKNITNCSIEVFIFILKHNDVKQSKDI